MHADTYQLIARLVASDPPTAAQANRLRARLQTAEDPEPERLLSRRQVADLLDVHPNTVDNLRKRGQLNAVPNGRHPRFRKSEIEALMQKGWKSCATQT